MNITVTQAPPQQIEVEEAGSIHVELTTLKDEVEVGNYLPRQELFISPTAPDTDMGLWIQTFADGTFEIWFKGGN